MALLARVGREDESCWCSSWSTPRGPQLVEHVGVAVLTTLINLKRCSGSALLTQHRLWPARIQIGQLDHPAGGQPQCPITFVERQHLAISGTQGATETVAQFLQAGITATNDQAIEFLLSIVLSRATTSSPPKDLPGPLPPQAIKS